MAKINYHWNGFLLLAKGINLASYTSKASFLKFYGIMLLIMGK